jgi:hypothetical protein
VIRNHFNILSWPAHSAGLSPIELIWAIIKRRLKGRRFNDEIGVFTATQTEWDLLDQRTIDNLLSSFRARCQVCVAHNGESLNGHWRDGHALHHGAAPPEIPAEPDGIE